MGSPALRRDAISDEEKLVRAKANFWTALATIAQMFVIAIFAAIVIGLFALLFRALGA